MAKYGAYIVKSWVERLKDEAFVGKQMSHVTPRTFVVEQEKKGDFGKVLRKL